MEYLFLFPTVAYDDDDSAAASAADDDDDNFVGGLYLL